MQPIRSTYEDDPDMLELVQSFAEELPERASALEALLANGQLDDLQVLAHQLKGAGGGYGFQVITDVAASLERALKEGRDLTAVKQSTDQLCAVLRAVVVPEAS
jgi:HPt (histidine-containing phosphotransfer) domain-containing protein